MWRRRCELALELRDVVYCVSARGRFGGVVWPDSSRLVRPAVVNSKPAIRAKRAIQLPLLRFERSELRLCSEISNLKDQFGRPFLAGSRLLVSAAMCSVSNGWMSCRNLVCCRWSCSVRIWSKYHLRQPGDHIRRPVFSSRAVALTSVFSFQCGDWL